MIFARRRTRDAGTQAHTRPSFYEASPRGALFHGLPRPGISSWDLETLSSVDLTSITAEPRLGYWIKPCPLNSFFGGARRRHDRDWDRYGAKTSLAAAVSLARAPYACQCIPLIRVFATSPELGGASYSGSSVLIERMIISMASHLLAASGYPSFRNISTSRHTYPSTPIPPKTTRASAISRASLSE